MKLKLITEMPLVGYHVNDNVVGKSDKDSLDNQFSPQSANALRAPKVLTQLTKVLNRSRHKIIVIADQKPPRNFRTRPTSAPNNVGFESALSDQYYQEAGIDPNTAKDAITMVISFDNSEGQHNLSPWMILHQIGEVATNGGENTWWIDLFHKYAKHLQVPLARGREEEVRMYAYEYGSDGKSAFSHIFNMKSAREFIHGGFSNYDMDQELVTEYLWYGGNIRVNYPDWIDKKVVDTIKAELEYEIGKRLDSMTGKAFNNSLF
jgi:hypothetical protein